MNTPGEDLAPAALAIARVEYPSLETSPYLELLDQMGEEASARIGTAGRGPFEDAVRAFNEYFYDEQGFRGNRDRYDDPRNSFLNEVLNRRTGIPISLAVVYIEVARRAGLRVAGVNFPGHFLLRAPLATPTRLADDILIVDPFHKGAFLSEIDCRELLRQHVGDAAAFDRSLLEPATRHQIVVRMLVNLETALRTDAILPAGALHLGPAADRRSIRDRRAPRPRPARLPSAGFCRRVTRPGGVPATSPDNASSATTKAIRLRATAKKPRLKRRASTSKSGSTSRRSGSESRGSIESGSRLKAQRSASS